MHKPIPLLAAICCALSSFAQTDSISLFYKPDQYVISKKDLSRLDSFIFRAWDRITIKGYTDETEGEEYNLELSKRRSGEIYQYLRSKKRDSIALISEYFGEALPFADNKTETGRALNRRTVVLGFRYPRVAKKVVEDPMKPVTSILDNGMIITYRPGTLAEDLAESFRSGSGVYFNLITNTTGMRQNNLYNNTTNGEILSSVLIICNNGYEPCQLDSPVLVRVPVPFRTKCPIEKVKFFNAVAERGKMIWQEQTKALFPEEIDGQQYIRLWIDNFCGCINFDFKIDPECFGTDSSRIEYVNTDIRNLTAELLTLNSVYMPRKINDSTHSLIYLKDHIADARLSFALYANRKRIKSFKDEPLENFPYDSAQNKYFLQTGTVNFYFPKKEIWDIVLKINNDKYRVFSDERKFDFTYLRRSKEKITIDFTVKGPRSKYITYYNIPLTALEYDPVSNYYIIDKRKLKELKPWNSLAQSDAPR